MVEHNLPGRNLRVSRYELPFFQMGRWLCSSTQSKSVCKIGLRDFASSVIEYSNACSEFACCVRETRPCRSSSFNRRATVVEDESTRFLQLRKSCWILFLSKTINMCNDFDLVKSESNSSTLAIGRVAFLFHIFYSWSAVFVFSCNKTVTK